MFKVLKNVSVFWCSPASVMPNLTIKEAHRLLVSRLLTEVQCNG